MKIPSLLLLLPILALNLPAETSPYAGQQARNIKALSADEIDGYLAGRGMGLARPAELNGYPGPRHVLDLATELKLSGAQVSQLETIFREMRDAAIPLGQLLVARESELDRLFTSRQASQPALRTLTAEIGRLQGELRSVHLGAHIRTEQLLSAEQNSAYRRLRGYAAPDAPLLKEPK